MNLTELFNTNIPWNWETQTDEDWVARFRIDDVEYVVRIEARGQYGNWVVEFENKSVPQDKKFSVTGQGNSEKVFSTVANIMKNFTRRNDVYTMTFIAEEPNRARLYKRMAARIFPKYKLIDDGDWLTYDLTEGKLKNLQIDTEYDTPLSPAPPPVQEPKTLPTKGPEYYILVNTRPWKRGGELVKFSNRQKALNSAYAISKRSRDKVKIEIKEV